MHTCACTHICVRWYLHADVVWRVSLNLPDLRLEVQKSRAQSCFVGVVRLVAQAEDCGFRDGVSVDAMARLGKSHPKFWQ